MKKTKQIQHEFVIKDEFFFSWSPLDPVLNATNKNHPLAITTEYINTVSQFGPMEEVRSAFRNQEMPIFLRMIDKDSGEI